MSHTTQKASFRGLIPLLAFIFIYLGTGFYFHLTETKMAFYQLPSPIAAMIGIIVALILFKDHINQKLETFIQGCGNSDIITMCMIYLLAGAFVAVTNTIGGIESTANLGLAYISPQYITAGIFVITGLISLAIGTSVGTIVAVAPIAIELATQAHIPLPIMLSAIMGGAMFGDDLSMISDTTIAATRTQHCRMKDKFLANIGIAIPASIMALILFLILGKPTDVVLIHHNDYHLLKVMPYLFVLILSLVGVNVFIVLIGGILLSGGIGLYEGTFELIGFAKEAYHGFTQMNEIFLLSMLTGGLAALVTKAGGIEWILQKIKPFIKGRKSAELGIGLLVTLTDFAVANNTVAIIINGSIAKNIAEQYGIDKRRVAGILGIFSCIAQGIIPYGAQMLILIGFCKGIAEITPFDVIPLLWYQQFLLLLTLISIVLPFYKKFLK